MSQQTKLDRLDKLFYPTDYDVLDGEKTANFETKPRGRVDSVAAKSKKTPPRSAEDGASPKASPLPTPTLTRSGTSIIKDIGGPEDTKKLLGLVLLLVAAFLLKKYLDF